LLFTSAPGTQKEPQGKTQDIVVGRKTVCCLFNYVKFSDRKQNFFFLNIAKYFQVKVLFSRWSVLS